MQRGPCKDTQRQSYAATNQEMPWSQQKLEEAGKDSFPESLEGEWAC